MTLFVSAIGLWSSCRLLIVFVILFIDHLYSSRLLIAIVKRQDVREDGGAIGVSTAAAEATRYLGWELNIAASSLLLFNGKAVDAKVRGDLPDGLNCELNEQGESCKEN